MPRRIKYTFNNTITVQENIYSTSNNFIGGGGSVSNLNDVADVNIVVPIDNNLLVYSNGEWSNLTLELNNLQNITLSGEADNDILLYSNGFWKNIDTNGTLPTKIENFNDVSFNNLQNDELLIYSNGGWTNNILGLGNLDTVDLGTVVQDNALIYSNGIWSNITVGEPILLEEITSVDAPADFNVLTYSNADWVNKILPISELNGVSFDTLTEFNVLMYSNGGWKNKFVDFNDLENVNINTPIEGNVLTYINSVWSNDSFAIPTLIENLTSIDTPEENNVLQYKNGDWSNGSFGVPTLLENLTSVDTPQENDVLTYSNSSWIDKELSFIPTTLEDMTNIDTPSEFHILTYSNSSWSNKPLLLDNLEDVTFNNKQPDDILIYNNNINKWINFNITDLFSQYNRIYGGTLSSGTNVITFDIEVTTPLTTDHLFDIKFYAYNSTYSYVSELNALLRSSNTSIAKVLVDETKTSGDNSIISYGFSYIAGTPNKVRLTVTLVSGSQTYTTFIKYRITTDYIV